MKKKMTIAALFLALCLTACGETAVREESGTAEAVLETEMAALPRETEATEEVSLSSAEELFLLTSVDTANGSLTLKSVSDGSEMTAAYTGATTFYDKYGSLVSLAQFEPGDAVELSFFDNGVLSSARLSGAVWNVEDITDYTLDIGRMVFSYQGSNYRLRNDIPVYTNGRDTGIYSIQDGDSLDVTGVGKDILSMTVTTGLGTIELRNVGVFLDGWLNMDNTTYLTITEDMKIPATEGTHVLTVANDGWGDSTVVAVKRGQSVAVDLEALKGEGPKYCELMVVANVEEPVIRLDGKEISSTGPTSVRYGMHVLTVSAEGYDVWERRLIVNSRTAEIEAELTPGGTSASASAASAATAEQAAAENAEPGVAGSLAGSVSGASSSSSATREAEQAAAEAYLDTLTGVLDTLTGTSLSGDE